MNLLRAFNKTALPEILVFALGGFLIARPALLEPYPTGYAGLYTLMAETLRQNAFALPASVPYYASTPIPFAYPPLAFYIEALTLSLTPLNALDYARFFPVLTGVLTLIAAWWFFRQASADRATALIATLFLACAHIFHEYHIQAAGIVRGPALLWTFLTLGLAWPTPSRLRPAQIMGVGFFFGLTLLTHLAYATFLILSLAILTIFRPAGSHKTSLFSALLSIGAGLLLASPWWLSLLNTYGADVFLRASATHQNPLLAQAFASPTGPIQALLTGWIAFGPWLKPAALTGFALVGIAYWIAQKQTMRLAWLAALIYLMGESLRFQAILYALAAAEAASAALRAQWNTHPSAAPRQAIAAVLLILFLLSSAAISQQQAPPVLTTEAISLAAWMQTNTPADARYLYFDSNPDGLNEWLPYLARRTPSIGHWGHEWLGDYTRQAQLTFELAACARQQSWPCAQDLLQKNNIQYQYLILPGELASLHTQASQNLRLQAVYENAQYVVYIVK